MKSNSSKTTIGLDLGDRKHAYWALDGKGEVLREGSIPNTRGDLEEFSEKFPGALIAMEVGMQSPWTSRYFQELGHRVLVANARKVRAICQNDRKNDRKSDRKDAEMLARLARSDEKLLSPSRALFQLRRLLQDTPSSSATRLIERPLLTYRSTASFLNSSEYGGLLRGISVFLSQAAHFVSTKSGEPPWGRGHS